MEGNVKVTDLYKFLENFQLAVHVWFSQDVILECIGYLFRDS